MGCGASLPVPADFELTSAEEDIGLRFQLTTNQMGNLVFIFNDIASGHWKTTEMASPKRKSMVEHKNADAVPTSDFHAYFGTNIDTLYHRHLFEIIGDTATHGSLNRVDFLQSIAMICSLNIHMMTDYSFNAFEHVEGDKGISQAVFARQVADLEAHSPTRLESGKVMQFVKELSLPRDSPIDSASFHEMALAVPHLIWPALRMQELFRKKTLGVTTWTKISETPRSTAASSLMGAATAIDTRKRQYRATKYLAEDPEEARRRQKEEQKERMKRAASKSKMRRAASKQNVNGAIHATNSDHGHHEDHNHHAKHDPHQQHHDTHTHSNNNTTMTSAPSSPIVDEKKTPALPGAVDDDSPTAATTTSHKSNHTNTTISSTNSIHIPGATVSSAPLEHTRDKLLVMAEEAQNEADAALLDDDQPRADAAQAKADALRAQAAARTK